MKATKLYKSWNLYFKTFFILVFAVHGFGQNTSSHIYEADNISEVSIDATKIFTISATVTETEQITVNSLSEGEHGSTMALTAKETDGVLKFQLSKASLKTIPDDKLNAHKVMSSQLNLELPKNKSLSIISDVGSVNLNGSFKNLNIKLSQGNFTANATAINAIVETFDGNIMLKTKEAIIETDSHKGLVDIPNNMFGFSRWKLKTNSGSIVVQPKD